MRDDNEPEDHGKLWTPEMETMSQVQRGNALAQRLAEESPDIPFLTTIQDARRDRRITHYESVLVITKRSIYLQSNRTPREMNPEKFQ